MKQPVIVPSLRANPDPQRIIGLDYDFNKTMKGVIDQITPKIEDESVLSDMLSHITAYWNKRHYRISYQDALKELKDESKGTIEAMKEYLPENLPAQFNLTEYVERTIGVYLDIYDQKISTNRRILSVFKEDKEEIQEMTPEEKGVCMCICLLLATKAPTIKNKKVVSLIN